MPLQQSAASLADVLVPVRSEKPKGTVFDPTADVVQMAFLTDPTANPVPADWHAASWETDTATTPHTYYAVCLVGPAGTVALTAAVYWIWVKITDSPEAPVLRVDTLTVT